MTPSPTIHTFPTPVALSAAAAEAIVREAQGAVAARGRFTLALAGGNTPRATYELLGGELGGRMPWKETEFFFGDERWVPPDDARSNFAMAMATLFKRAPVAAEQVHLINTGMESPEAAALAYESLLRERCENQAGDAVDGDEGCALDLVLLGVGADGHTASLFPGTSALDETRRWVVPVEAPAYAQPPQRITLTYPALNAARAVFFLVAGADKRAVLTEILAGGERAARYPAGRVAARERTEWFADAAARGGGAGAASVEGRA